MEDGSPLWLLLSFALCLAGGFYFSCAEMALASVNRIRMRSHAENDDRRAKRVLYILEHFDQALTALIIGSDIANLTCATLATVFASRLWGPSAVPYASVGTAVVVFLLAETTPKSLAKSSSEGFALKVSSSLLVLMRLLWPLIFVFTRVNRLLQKPFARLSRQQPTVTEDELYDFIEDAMEEGALDEETGELVHSAIEYANATVRDILTPWKDVLKLPLYAKPQEALATLKQNAHSRIPVVGETGEVAGLLHIRAYLKATLRDGAPPSVASMVEPVNFAPDTTAVDDLLSEMSNKKTHFTIVRDQWENVLGIVTMEDILETLVGEIYDEDDTDGEEGGRFDAR